MTTQRTVTKSEPVQPVVFKREARTARVEARTSPTKKALYQRAADLRGQTFTEFVEASLDEAAARVHKEYQAMVLSKRESKDFVAAMLANAKPSRTLVAAAKRYKAQTDS